MITERVSLAHIFKEDGYVKIEYNKDLRTIYELFGFLKCTVNRMENELTMYLQNMENEE